jgi:hypothetical protein
LLRRANERLGRLDNRLSISLNVEFVHATNHTTTDYPTHAVYVSCRIIDCIIHCLPGRNQVWGPDYPQFCHRRGDLSNTVVQVAEGWLRPLDLVCFYVRKVSYGVPIGSTGL